MMEDHIKRCDVRVPIELYNEIETIAVEEYNAPTYKKTGRPQVSQTILELIRLGIENLKNEVSDNSSDRVSDILVKRLDDLEDRIKGGSSDNSSDKMSDTVESLVNEKLGTAIADQLPSVVDDKIKPLIIKIKQLKKNFPLLRTSLA